MSSDISVVSVSQEIDLIHDLISCSKVSCKVIAEFLSKEMDVNEVIFPLNYYLAF